MGPRYVGVVTIYHSHKFIIMVNPRSKIYCHLPFRLNHRPFRQCIVLQSDFKLNLNPDHSANLMPNFELRPKKRCFVFTNFYDIALVTRDKIDLKAVERIPVEDHFLETT